MREHYFVSLPIEVAKERGIKTYRTINPCVNGHLSERLVSSGMCKECARARYEMNKEKEKLRVKKWREENPIQQKESDRNYRERNLEKRREYNRQWSLENPDANRRYYEKNQNKERDRIRQWREENPEYARQYYQENPEKSNAKNAKRRASKLQRTLPGYDDEIQAIYTEASLMRSNGRDVHVDHIVPLQGENVSGLHVPWNLAIIPASENVAKSNRFEPIIEVYD